MPGFLEKFGIRTNLGSDTEEQLRNDWQIWSGRDHLSRILHAKSLPTGIREGTVVGEDFLRLFSRLYDLEVEEHYSIVHIPDLFGHGRLFLQKNPSVGDEDAVEVIEKPLGSDFVFQVHNHPFKSENRSFLWGASQGDWSEAGWLKPLGFGKVQAVVLQSGIAIYVNTPTSMENIRNQKFTAQYATELWYNKFNRSFTQENVEKYNLEICRSVGFLQFFLPRGKNRLEKVDTA